MCTTFSSFETKRFPKITLSVLENASYYTKLSHPVCFNAIETIITSLSRFVSLSNSFLCSFHFRSWTFLALSSGLHMIGKLGISWENSYHFLVICGIPNLNCAYEVALRIKQAKTKNSYSFGVVFMLVALNSSLLKK